MTRSHRLILALATVVLGHAAPAGARQGEPPPSVRLPSAPLDGVPELLLPAMDADALRAEDEALAEERRGGPARFAERIEVQVSPETHGAWESLPGGGQLWRLRVRAPGATDLNLGFTRFRLPPGATLHVVSEEDGSFEGPYGAADVRDHAQLWVPVVPGDSLVIELFVPVAADFPPQLSLYHVGYGYRDLFGRLPTPKQGACNNDVICPEGDPWRDEIQSVAVYGTGGGTFCTGQLISNLQACGQRQFFLTAGHCGITAGNAASVTVYWNFASPTCGALSGGSLAQNQTGATYLSGTGAGGSDVTLLELDAVPDPAWNVYYAGWDRSDAIPGGSVAIHHPNTDEKAISFNTDPLTYSVAWSGADTHWRVDDWEDGTTEPGSSGSGLFDPATRLLIGTLSGGSASCASITNDFYGRFAAQWASGLSAELDPDGVGALQAPGCYPGTNVRALSHASLVDSCASGGPGDGNGAWEPGEQVQFSVELVANQLVTGVQGTLSSRTPGVTIVDGTADWPDLAAGTPSSSLAPHFTIALDQGLACTADVELDLDVTAVGEGPWRIPLVHPVGSPLVAQGVPLPTVNEGTVSSDILVSSSVSLTDLDVEVRLQHARVGDLTLRLRSPAGTMLTLLDRPGVPASGRGCADDDMDVLFDDASAFDPEPHCDRTTPWYSGAAAPTRALAAFAGEDSAGTWTLFVDDGDRRSGGTLLDWNLLFSPSVDCTRCGLPASEPDCGNGLDDDGDGAIDCADSDCAADPLCNPEPDCGNGLDDDGDGAIDCADSDCDADPLCNPEPDCGNGLDDDGDGAIDCDDSDCDADPLCNPEPDCGNGLDDDGDGAIDCADSDCAADPLCNPEPDCGNGLDDDGDGAIDCADSDCAADPLCNPEPDCGNGLDDDGDGAIDCDDSDCAADPGCAAPDLAINRQVVLSVAGGAVPPLAAVCDPACAAPDHVPCTDGPSDALVPGALPLTLPGEALPSGTSSLWLYHHADPTQAMRLQRIGADLALTAN